MGAAKFGLQLWTQNGTWPEYRDAAVAAEAAGWDAVFTWDHLLAIQGDWAQPIFEGWTLITALATVTSRVRVGLTVAANTFRSPGLTVKLATTLDHVSNGRSVLGLGGAWFEREHEAFGIDFGTSVGDRLDRLEEAASLVRRLLDGERVTHQGYYTMVDAVCEPRPIQTRLPILIGGSGPQKTLRTVARYADAWNTGGDLEALRARLDILAQHCADAGRDMSEIELSAGFPMIIGSSVEAAQRRRNDQLAFNGVVKPAPGPALIGPPEVIAELYRPYFELGFTSVLVRMPAPIDRETIDRLPELMALLAG